MYKIYTDIFITCTHCCRNYIIFFSSISKVFTTRTLQTEEYAHKTEKQFTIHALGTDWEYPIIFLLCSSIKLSLAFGVYTSSSVRDVRVAQKILIRATFMLQFILNSLYFMIVHNVLQCKINENKILIILKLEHLFRMVQIYCK